MPWLAVTLQLDAVLAETFSEALLEAGAQSVSLDQPGAPRVAVEALVSPDADLAALVARAAAACELHVAPLYAVSRLEDEDWVRRSQAQFASQKIGERLWIVPSWREPPTHGTVVRLDPGLAFGTGSHPTTRLVLRFLEQRIRGGERVLDYGCGSGILAIAAAKLGAGRVAATDIDPAAREATAANAGVNGVVLELCAPEDLGSDSYDIVVANILAQPLIVLAPLLAALTAPGGRLALAGILESQAADVVQAYATSFNMVVAETEEGWSLLEGIRQ